MNTPNTNQNQISALALIAPSATLFSTGNTDGDGKNTTDGAAEANDRSLAGLSEATSDPISPSSGGRIVFQVCRFKPEPSIMSSMFGEQEPSAPVFSANDVDGLGKITASGMADAGATVTVTWPNGDSGDAVADSAGHWSLVSAAVQPEGRVSASAIDVNSRQSLESVVDYVDNVAPQEVAQVVLGDPDADGRINASGVAEVGSRVVVTWPDGSVSNTLPDDTGYWRAASAEVQTSGTITVVVMDAVGNDSPETLLVYEDVTAPQAPTILAMGDADSDGKINASGTAEVNSMVVISWPDGSATRMMVDGTGHWDAESPMVQTSGVVSVVSVDMAGNTSSPTMFDYRDITPPKAPTIATVDDKDGNGKISLGGTAETNSTIEVTWPDGKVGTIVTDGSGHWSLESRDVQVGGQVSVCAIDQAGNRSPIEYAYTVAPVRTSDILMNQGGYALATHGYSVSAAGDVNGDGYDDFITGKNATGATSVEVIFGGPGGRNGGFSIADDIRTQLAGASVSITRDLNGDGLADLIVGVPGQTGDPGECYVVYGKADGATVKLTDVAAGNGGFVIKGGGINSGISVSSAGDVNGDGLSDMIVGAFEGKSYVVFGKTNNAEIDLSKAALGYDGFVISEGNGVIKHAVSGAGDVNGDGLDDLLVGSPYFAKSYVVFGKATGEAIDLATVERGVGGFSVSGAEAFHPSASGYSVSAAGDVNGDGLADMVFGDDQDGARSYVVFGKIDGSAIDLAAVSAGVGGFVMAGGGGHVGYNVSAAGDVNGDGLADLILGAPYMGIKGNAYVVYGKADGRAVDLAAVAQGIGGFLVDGTGPDGIGVSVAAGGDLNGDGFADLVAGSGNNGTYVIYGGKQFATGVDQVGGVSADTLRGTAGADALVGGAGDDVLIGGGGADVLYAGAGNDAIHLNVENVAALSAGITDGQLARIDGGGGIDVLVLDGTGIMLDLTLISNVGRGHSRIESIERIDLGTGNELTIDMRDVMDMAAINVFNSANGWTGLGAAVSRHQVIVDGTVDDTVSLRQGASGWTDTGAAVNHGGHTYEVWTAGGVNGAQLLIDQLLTVNANV